MIENMMDKALQPIYWLQDVMILAFLLTVLWFLTSAAYQELRYGVAFSTFRRQNACLLPFVFGILLFFITAVIWWFKGFP